MDWTKFVNAICKIITQILERKPDLPAPPKQMGTITDTELRAVLKGAGLRDIHLGSAEYKLTSVKECKRFLKWYRDKHPYKRDAYDCNIFALVQHAEAAKWMNNEYVWGHIWAEGLDEEYAFPNHGFNFIVNHERKVYFCDELQVAAPKDDFMPAYEVRCYLVET